ncbi:MAG: hypothetical protein ACPLZD_05590 [Candidatus Saccharicenans sp.]|nr:MAG: hypothetical protein C0168_09980 [Candidatus Aminicenantes bacterium]
MKRYLILMGLILIMASVTFFSPKALSEELLIKHPIPFGWKFKDLEMGEKYIGICFWPDIELNGHEPQIFPRTLVQILDKKSGRVILEVKTEAGERFKLLKDNKIFLVKGDESGDDSIRMLDLDGKEYWRIKWPQGLQSVKGQVLFDLRGKEFAYVDLVWGSLSTPAVVYDLDSGKEKFIYGPLNLPEKLREAGFGLKVFLPIGEDNLFLMGIGASVFLKHYDNRKDIWTISDIGGNISSGKFLNDDYVGLNYWRREEKNKYISGLAVIEWKTGKIAFRLENIKINGVSQKKITIPYVDFIFLDKGDNSLVFNPDKDDNLVVKIPYNYKTKTWVEEKAKRYRALVKYKVVGKSREYQKIYYGKYVVDENEAGGLKILRISSVSLRDED